MPYNFNVSENTDVGKIVFSKINITDADSIGEAIEVTCINTDSSQGCSVFETQTIESEQNKYNGQIVLKKILNYAEQHTYKFSLKATVSFQILFVIKEHLLKQFIVFYIYYMFIYP